MPVTGWIALSVAVQVAAGLLALRLVRVTGARSAWLLIALGLWGMAARRSLSLFKTLALGASSVLDLRFEVLGLVTSGFMLAGVCLIAPLFRSIGQAREAAEKALEEKQEVLGRLQEALANLRVLTGLLPICAGCKSIRDDQGAWHSLEAYVTTHSAATFTHGLCPRCSEELYPGLAGREAGCAQTTDSNP